MENLKTETPDNEKPVVSYEKREVAPGVTSYIFNKVGVVIDTSGMNQPDCPELTFGTFDDLENAGEEAVFLQPNEKRDIDMNYIAECVTETIKDFGGDAFWIQPYTEDSHSEARLRLFRKFADIEPDKNNSGYILRLKE